MPHAELLGRHANAFAEVLGEGALIAETVGRGDVDHFVTYSVKKLDSAFANPDIEALRQKAKKMIMNGRRQEADPGPHLQGG
jgi:hypothetical protein